MWYDERSPGLGSEFARIADAMAASILRFPTQFPKVDSEKRKAVFPRFPYSFLYQVIDDDILILACFHHRRDPREWPES